MDLMVDDLRRRLDERKLGVEITAAAKSWLAREGYDPDYGARPLRRALERHVENPLATRLLKGEFKEGASSENSYELEPARTLWEASLRLSQLTSEESPLAEPGIG